MGYWSLETGLKPFPEFSGMGPVLIPSASSISRMQGLSKAMCEGQGMNAL